MKNVLFIGLVFIQLLVIPKGLSATEKLEREIYSTIQDANEKHVTKKHSIIREKRRNSLVKEIENTAPPRQKHIIKKSKMRRKIDLNSYQTSFDEYLKKLSQAQSTQKLINELFPYTNNEGSKLNNQSLTLSRSIVISNNSDLSDTIKPVWVQEYTSNMLPSDEIGYKIITDCIGNSYVTHTKGIIKYDSNGTKVWQLSRKGVVAVDSSNNVIIAYYDSLVKYSPSGVRIWAIETGFSVDDIAIDRNNRIYLARCRISPWATYEVIVFSPSGEEEWWDYIELEYHKASDVYLFAIALTRYGSLYISGDVLFNDGDVDIWTAKFDTEDGFEWAKSYDSPGETDEYCYGISVDDQENVYITGEIMYTEEYPDPPFSTCITIKYSKTGVRKWAKKFNSPNSLIDVGEYVKPDNKGNLYVAGSCGHYTLDGNLWIGSLLLKYNSIGDLIWSIRYNWSQNYVSDIAGLFLNKEGEPLITCIANQLPSTQKNLTTIQYNSFGNVVWMSNYIGFPTHEYDELYSSTQDRNGDIYVTGYSYSETNGHDVSTIRIDQYGNAKWHSQYNGKNWSRDYATGVATDDSGNIYLFGSVMSYTCGTDYHIVKFDKTGLQQWTAGYNSANKWSAYDWLSDFAVDGEGNVYVTGESGWNQEKIVTIKYNSQGVQQWISEYSSDGGNSHSGKLRIDNEQSVYVAVNSGELIKYSSLGIKLWKTVFSSGCWLADMAVDPFGNIVITGSCGLIKVSKHGTIIWQVPEQKFSNIRIDKSGNIYGVKYQQLPGECQKFYTAKYNPSGVLLWSATYASPYNNDVMYPRLAIDKNNDVYICGNGFNPNINYDIVLIKYSTSGIEQWVRWYDSGMNLHDIKFSIVIDRKDNIYILGNNSKGYLILNYNIDGELIWSDCLQGISHYLYPDPQIYTDNNNNIYIAATTFKGFGNSLPHTAMILAKYSTQEVFAYPKILVCDTINIGCDNPKSFKLINPSSTIARISNIVCSDSNFNLVAEKDFILPMDSIECVVLYSPKTTGHHKGKITIFFANDSYEDTVYVSGTTIDKIPLEISNVHISFDPIHIGCEQRTTIVLKNINKCKAILSIESDNQNFIVSHSNLELLPNEFKQLEVIFNPFDIGNIAGNIKIISNLAGEQSINAEGVSIEYQNTRQIDLLLNKHWQLISIPVETKCFDKLGIVFEYSNGYLIPDVYLTGKGYWKKKINKQSLKIFGNLITSKVITVNKGWNLIGSITDPIPVSSIITEPQDIIISKFVTYADGYRISDTIQPGKGYWVKVSEPGQIILNSNSAKTNSKQDLETIDLQKYNTLTFKNSDGQTATIYFGIKPSENFPIDYLELPPVPPSEIFDARFGSQRILETVDIGKTGRFPIIVSGSEYPIYLSWKINNPNILAVIEINGEETKLIESGTIIISNSINSVTLYLYGFKDFPNRFVLEQNYPNPFNPTTSIKYQLPQASKVLLKIYNIYGEEVKTLVNEIKEAGCYEIIWNGDNNLGNPVASGIYFYRLNAGNFTSVKKMVVMR